MLQDSEAKVLVTTEAMSKKLAFTGTWCCASMLDAAMLREEPARASA